MALKTWQLLSVLERIFALENGGDMRGQDSESSKATKAALSQWLSGSCLANVKNEIREPQMMGVERGVYYRLIGESEGDGGEGNGGVWSPGNRISLSC